ncbi:hypothetical protein AB7714_05755 [Tardiphaga sp. 1201_B9_N1_1]|uniref:hypothetical protein n=1 Tax=unclassified Tardiphaga TaxID=2631404 RepID=UPI003F252C96
MCNASNHSPSCPCGFGGDTGGGRGWGSVAHFTLNYEPPSFGWSRDGRGTVESYVNPNARCPECGADVFFYRSPYNGRVYFDELGWPWPKHGCTDNAQEPRRATSRGGTARPAERLQWHIEGWVALLSPRIGSAGERRSIRGDSGDDFVDLVLPVGTQTDPESPIFVRPHLPGLYEVTFLISDGVDTRPATAVGFDGRLAPIGDTLLALAAKSDTKGLYAVGRRLLWDLDDQDSARPYLEAAATKGHFDALIDLAVIALLRPRLGTA